MARSLAVVSLSDVRLSGDGVGGSSRLGARGAMTGHGSFDLNAKGSEDAR